MGILGFGLKLTNTILKKFNKRLVVSTLTSLPVGDKVMLNIGSGDWFCPGWQNLDYPSEWYSKAQTKNAFIPYDARNDNLPFPDNSVDLIYSSYMLEHIENKYAEKMLLECFRVLKKEGTMRLVIPDAEFLYEISKHDTDFWDWRNSWKGRFFKDRNNNVRPVDWLVREIATPKMLQYIHSINTEDYISQFNSLNMYDFFEYLTHDLGYRKEYPGDHINYWTFEKAKKMLSDVGFDSVIHSKWSASCNKNMRNTNYFDISQPKMGLYIDIIK